MSDNPYRALAQRLDSLPNGFPATDDGAELRILEYLFSPEEAALAAEMHLTPETPQELTARIGGDAKELKGTLKGMVRKGLIKVGRRGVKLGYRLMPFVVGIYEYQVARIDEEFATLFEDYYQKAFGRVLAVDPPVHRVIPVNASIPNTMEILPHQSVTEVVENARAWGVQECICRKQKALIGDPCDHPVENCLVLYPVPGVFALHPFIRPLSREGALDLLKEAAEAGLVHSVSNAQDGIGYVCNCCTCSCGILRGISDLGIANTVARSAYVNQVDEEACLGCGDCVDYCQFGALTLIDVASVNSTRCVGCGVCVTFCPEEALHLVSRPEEELMPIPETEGDWMHQRAEARGLGAGWEA